MSPVSVRRLRGLFWCAFLYRIEVGGVFSFYCVHALRAPCSVCIWAYGGLTSPVSYVRNVRSRGSFRFACLPSLRPMTATATVCGRTFYTCYSGYTYYVPHGHTVVGSMAGYAVPAVRVCAVCMVASRDAKGAQ